MLHPQWELNAPFFLSATAAQQQTSAPNSRSSTEGNGLAVAPETRSSSTRTTAHPPCSCVFPGLEKNGLLFYIPLVRGSSTTNGTSMESQSLTLLNSFVGSCPEVGFTPRLYCERKVHRSASGDIGQKEDWPNPLPPELRLIGLPQNPNRTATCICRFDRCVIVIVPAPPTPTVAFGKPNCG